MLGSKKRKQGREIVSRREVIFTNGGSKIVFHTKFDPDADYMPSELEKNILNLASSDAIRDALHNAIIGDVGTKKARNE